MTVTDTEQRIVVFKRSTFSGTQREQNSKPLKHSIDERFLVFKPGRYRHIFIS